MTQPIAFVLLQIPGPPDLLALVDTLRQRHPELSWNTDSAIANRPRCPFILCGSRIVVLLALDAPFPVDDGVWARAATTWPEAHGAAARHRAHVIVSLMGESESSIEDARIVTAVVGGLIATASDPCGVVFCGTVARSPEVWLELSTQTFAPYPDYPFMLWIDIAQFQPGPQIGGALTWGLSRFTGREIEFEAAGPSPGLIQRVAGLAGYIIEHGDQVDDGDTIENSDGERIEVRHGVSRFSGAPVLRAGPEGTLIGTGETMSAQHVDHRSLQPGDA